MHSNHRKDLRFQGKVYQFKAMCFGPTRAPGLFTKIIASVAAYLRVQNISLVAYLDDWLNSKFISRKATFGSRESAQFAVTTRFHNQQDKITISSQSENSLLRVFQTFRIN